MFRGGYTRNGSGMTGLIIVSGLIMKLLIYDLEIGWEISDAVDAAEARCMDGEEAWKIDCGQE